MTAKFILFFIFLNVCAFSQTKLAIKANIVNEHGQSIEDGEVYIFGDDGSLLTSTVVVGGQVEVGELKSGNYTIQVISEGYEILNHTISLSKDEVITLILKRSINQLSEVRVSSVRKTFTISNGNITANVAGSILSQTSNPLDLLSKLPGVQLSADNENIMLVGRGTPLLYIDNQQVSLTDFSNLSVDDIKTIEIIKNPSAKYEAAGRSVILITRKASKREGFEAQLSEVASWKRNFNNYLGINSSLKKGKTEFKANLNYNSLRPWEGLSSDFSIPNNGIISEYDAESRGKRLQYILGTSVYHQISDDDYFSASISGRVQDDNDRNTTQTFFRKENIENNIVTKNNNLEDRNFFNSFANYNKKLESLNGILFTGIQYSNFYQNSESVILNNFDNTQFDLTQDRNQRFKVDVFSARTDFEKTYENDTKFEIGALYLSANANTKFEVVDYVGTADDESDYDFDEQNIAGYSQLGGKISSVGYSVGIRVEKTIIRGKYLSSSTPLIDKKYVNYFPKVQLDYEIDSTKSVSVNYAKSIARPNYSATSQISIYTNPYLVFSRNINLDPTITDELSATYQYKDKSLKFNYYQSKDPVFFSYSYDAAANLTTFNSENYDLERGINLELQLPFKYKWWTSVSVMNFIYNKIEDEAAILNESKPYLYLYSNHQFSLPKKYTISISGWGFTERKEGVFERNALMIVDLAASKTFFENLDCTISFNDIFKNMNFNDKFTINNISSNSTYYVDAREFSISLKYRFGRIKDSNFQERNINENINRVN